MNPVKLDQLIGDSKTLVSVRDAATRKYLYINHAYEQYFKVEEHEVIGKTVDEIFGTKTGIVLDEFDDTAIDLSGKDYVIFHDTISIGDNVFRTFYAVRLSITYNGVPAIVSIGVEVPDGFQPTREQKLVAELKATIIILQNIVEHHNNK